MTNNKFQPILLILDDEEMVTTSLRNLFRLQTDYKILVYMSPEEALSEGKNHTIDLVITENCLAIPMNLPLGLALGLAFTPVSYFVVDREIIQCAPRVFSRHWPWALGNMLGGAMTQEVIARFGLLTIGVYLFRRLGFMGHPWPAIGLVSLIGCAGSYVFLLKFDLAQEFFTSQIALGLATAFFLQWIFCEVYVRKGFLAALCIHFGLNIKLFVYALVLD